MKIIDILNKIANGKKIPKRIVYNDEVWHYEPETNDYLNQYENDGIFNYSHIPNILNDEVEVLEITKEQLNNFFKDDNKQDKIGKCDIDWNTTFPLPAKDENEAFIMTGIQYLGVKINEIIDKLNNL